jgi:hypothetical protein
MVCMVWLPPKEYHRISECFVVYQLRRIALGCQPGMHTDREHVALSILLRRSASDGIMPTAVRTFL